MRQLLLACLLSCGSCSEHQASSGAQASARELLALHWASEWPRIESELAAAGADLDQPIDPTTLSSWESSHERIRAAISRYLEDGRSDWIRQYSEVAACTESASVTASTVERKPDVLRAEAAELHVRLVELAELSYQALVDADTTILESDGYQRDFLVARPLASVESKDERFFTTRQWSDYPWFVSYTIRGSEHPNLLGLMDEIGAVRARIHSIQHELAVAEDPHPSGGTTDGR
jgi:hypothetical protein